MRAQGWVHAAVAAALLSLAACSSEDAGTTTLVVNGIDAESGSVWQSGEVFLDVAAVGDTVTTNKAIRGFVSFDITAVPPGKEIVAATLNLSDYVIRAPEQDPFLAPNPLGNFLVMAQNYGALEAGDYAGAAYATIYNAAQGGAALAAIDASAALTGALGNSYNRFQVRLQFATESNGDGVAQIARFNDTAARLTVEYR